jgi:AcrR family transcriptional regulator
MLMARTSPPPIPLRARKRAATRIALVEALTERLAERTLEEIQVSELAEAAGISQATFFNYFPAKADVLTHFIQLWSLRVSAVARRVRAESDGALAALEALFVDTAEAIAPAPKVMLETLAHQARMPRDLQTEPIEYAERALLLPDEEDVESLADGGLSDILPRLLREAVDNGELPKGADADALTVAVSSIFFGVPLVLGQRAPEAIAHFYRQQLALLWAGVHAHSEVSS